MSVFTLVIVSTSPCNRSTAASRHSPMSFIILSGLPGSGKSTVARGLAPHLRLPLLDKDDFLEALFEEQGTGAGASRGSSSREADQRLVAAAQAVTGACLVSW